MSSWGSLEHQKNDSNAQYDMDTSTPDSQVQTCEYQTEHDCDLPGDSEYKIVSHPQYHLVVKLRHQYDTQDLEHLNPLQKYRRKLLHQSHERLCVF